MNESLPLYDISEELQRTQTAQYQASDPQSSVWVSANAGTGKTHVLTRRVLRLLITGTKPERILCLTYTRAAASEMSKRVFSELSRFISIDEVSLHSALTEILSRAPSKDEIDRARTLFTQAIETPGGFKVQTIHAFSERLLQRFPLEAGVTPGFQILEDTEAQKLKRESLNKVLEMALQGPETPLGKSLSIAVSFATEDTFEDILNEALNYQSWLENILQNTTQKHSVPDRSLDEIAKELRKYFDVESDRKANKIEREIFNTFSQFRWSFYAKIYEKGSASDIQRSEILKRISACSNEQDFINHLYKLFFDTTNKPRKTFATKILQKIHPDIDQVFLGLQTQFSVLWKNLKAAELIEATLSLYHLAAAVFQHYKFLKERSAKLDFEDLIIRTKTLLLWGDAAQWVLYKLDSGLEHLLLDESQDTSLSQWAVIFALVQEFFGGEGANKVDRTIFAVGDEKQSIFSFQGAAPDMFVAMGEKIKNLAVHANKRFHKINLDVSFRSTKPILETVDTVFSNPSRTPGVTHDNHSLRHIPKRFKQPGSIEIWNKEYHTSPKFSDPWSPQTEEATRSPIIALANRIATTIEEWLEKGERLLTADRPIHPGDILILVRKRRPLADPILMALKSHGIPVAGADRLRLTEHIVVQDLVSLGQFLLLPEDDLALAEILKSPIFGLEDEDLLRFCNNRRSTLWKALLHNQHLDDRYSAAVDLLKRWRNAADFMPPYEFWSSILERDGVRKSIINRIGLEAAEPLDEFLNLALKYDLNAPASLTGFLHSIEEEDREIKRDTETARDEVRIMTVHGAKGLEAPIVFLPDTCCSGGRKQLAGRLLKLDHVSHSTSKNMPPFVWPIKGSANLDEVKGARSFLAKLENEEQDRLLYVALTRARDRLVIGGFETKLGCNKKCWYSLISDMLSVENLPSNSNKILYKKIFSHSSNSVPDYDKHLTSYNKISHDLPSWFKTKAPKENTFSIPITPSQIIPYTSNIEGDPSPEPPLVHKLSEPCIPRFIKTKDQKAEIFNDPFLRGKLTHSLLQYLPNLKPSLWEETALSYLSQKAHHLPNNSRISIVDKVICVLKDPNLGSVFSSDSKAEVPIIATLPNPKNPQKSIRVMGQIDRLSLNINEIRIVDFKTNRIVPSSISQIAHVYLYQLAAYRLALQQIFLDRPIRAGLLWTETPKIIEIPNEILEKYTKDLWTLDLDDLDSKINGF